MSTSVRLTFSIYWFMCSAVYSSWYFASQYSPWNLPRDKPTGLIPKAPAGSSLRGKGSNHSDAMGTFWFWLHNIHQQTKMLPHLNTRLPHSDSQAHWTFMAMRLVWGFHCHPFLSTADSFKLTTCFLVLNRSICVEHHGSVPNLVSVHQLCC